MTWITQPAVISPSCLVATLAQAYSCHSGDLSTIARWFQIHVQREREGGYSVFNTCLNPNRRGSGSACRSMYGGFVKWERGQRDDGEDSIAVQVSGMVKWKQCFQCLRVQWVQEPCVNTVRPASPRQGCTGVPLAQNACSHSSCQCSKEISEQHSWDAADSTDKLSSPSEYVRKEVL